MSEEKQARPDYELIAELVDPSVPKNEREHAAARQMTLLWEQLAEQVSELARLRMPAELVGRVRCAVEDGFDDQGAHSILSDILAWHASLKGGRMSDLRERLLRAAHHRASHHEALHGEAADEIERLREEQDATSDRFQSLISEYSKYVESSHAEIERLRGEIDEWKNVALAAARTIERLNAALKEKKG